MTREAQVLDALSRAAVGPTPVVVARVLNLDTSCDWCPVGPPKPGEQCATVPRTSAQRVARVLQSLMRQGKVGVVRLGRRRFYTRTT